MEEQRGLGAKPPERERRYSAPAIVRADYAQTQGVDRHAGKHNNTRRRSIHHIEIERIGIIDESDPDEAGAQPSMAIVKLHLPITNYYADGLPHPLAVLHPAAYQRLLAQTNGA